MPTNVILATSRQRSALRLEYLDGLRALAALYVVLFHAGIGFTGSELPTWARVLRRCLSFGHHAVAVFIVLSGYCLMLPVARAEGQLAGGARRYITRRAWRILPPYYAALFASLLLLWAIPSLATPTGTIWDDSSPAFAKGPIVSHLLLLHNLFPAWIYRINGPLWSVATEWQIYFFFPFLLLPIWRKLGIGATLGAGFLVGCAPLWFAPDVAARWIPWYLGLFSLGMCAAGIGFSLRPFEQRLLTSVPWKLVLIALVACCLVGGMVLAKLWFQVMPVSDAVVGATTAVLLVHCTRAALSVAENHDSAVLRLFEQRVLVQLGHFSYSLYLTHLPVVALCYLVLKRVPLAPAPHMLTMIALAVPASLVTAYAFFLVFERPFVARRLAPASSNTDGASG